jgi:hypothetical protein
MSLQNDKCDAKGCGKEFSMWETKHFCRACKSIFHGNCLSTARKKHPEFGTMIVVSTCPLCHNEMDE